MRTRAQADFAVRVVLLAGLAIGITGLAIVSKTKVLGIVLAAVGFVAAGFGPAFISVQDKPNKDTDERGETLE